MADETPQTPQPNGIRLMKPGTPGAGIQPTIRLKPIVPRPVAPAAAPAPAPAAPAPAAAAPAPAAPAPAPAAPAPAPAAPAAPAAAAASPASPPTVRLKPIAPLSKPSSATVNLKPTPTPGAASEEDLSATIQISAPPPVAPAGGLKPAVPLAKPIAPTPAIPVKSDQLQASKSKTSRISLDAALTANNGAAGGGPRTIRIKRPTDAPVGKLTSQIPPMGGATPAAPAPAAAEAPAAEGDVPLGQRRTIRVKRPGAPAAPAPAEPSASASGTAAPAAAEVVAPEFATDVPPPAFSGFEAAAEKTSPAFPILGLLAIIGFAIAIFFLLKGDANLFNAALWPSPR